MSRFTRLWLLNCSLKFIETINLVKLCFKAYNFGLILDLKLHLCVTIGIRSNTSILCVFIVIVFILCSGIDRLLRDFTCGWMFRLVRWISWIMGSHGLSCKLWRWWSCWWSVRISVFPIAQSLEAFYKVFHDSWVWFIGWMLGFSTTDKQYMDNVLISCEGVLVGWCR